MPEDQTQHASSQVPAPVSEQPTTEPATTEEEDLEAQLAYQNLKRRREARRRKRIVVIAVAVALALAAGIWFMVNKADEASSGEDFDPLSATAMVYRGDFATTITANGATEPLSSTVVTPEVDGIIENIQVAEGQHVEQGDVLFYLRNDSLDKAVREAEQQLESVQRAADSANAAVDEAYATYQREWDACNEADDWETFDEASLRASISAAEDAYEDALQSIESAREALAEAQQTADKRTVRAPVAGSIVQLGIQNGAAFGAVTGGTGSSAGEALVQISDLTQMKVTVEVNEVDIASIVEGQQAKATFSALPDVELDATVQRIASVSSGSGGDYGYGGVVTYAVDLLIPEPDPNLKPGMTATVTITTQSAPDALIVPAAAVWEGVADDGSDARFVTVVTDADKGETNDVQVQVIEENSSEAAVSGELADGDLVLLSGGGDMGDLVDGDLGMDMGGEDVEFTDDGAATELMVTAG